MHFKPFGQLILLSWACRIHPMVEDEYLTKEELRQLIKISRATLDLIMKRREVPYLKLGRRVLFKKADVDAWLESKRVK